MTTLHSVEELREIYAMPKGRTLQKVLPALDKHCKHFLSLSRFLVLSTHDANGKTDASPRGGAAGFTAVLDD
ncbi:MAG: pyridoxamine 5'-phosphate oxidase family protein, partial [Pseudomonadota bacterium]